MQFKVMKGQLATFAASGFHWDVFLVSVGKENVIKMSQKPNSVRQVTFALFKHLYQESV